MSSLVPLMELSPNPGEAAQFFPEYVPLDKIGIHTSRLAHLAMIGGFKPDVTVNYYDGDVTTSVPTIVGFDNQGSAVAGASKVIEAPIGTGTYSNSPSEKGWHNLHDLRLQVNVAELESRVKAEPGSGAARNPKVWAHHIHDALGQGLREAVWQHMVKDPTPHDERGYERLVIVLNTIALGSWVDRQATTQSNIERLLVITSLVLASSNVRKLAIGMQYQEKPKEQCFSLFPMYHLDRAAAVSVGSRCLKLAKAIT